MNRPTALWLRIVPAYAMGYFLSYGLRSINAVIAPELAQELNITASGLGLLTSAYFLGFGLFQLPLGMLLDHFGPRRVESVLLLVGAVGCLIFAAGDDLYTLAVGRALIGLGVSACLMASFKAFSQWFPIERMPSLTATIMVAGGLGALTVSTPVEMALPFLGWRGVFVGMALLLFISAGFLFMVEDKVPDARASSVGELWRSLRLVYGNRVFWRYAPQSGLTVGGFMALQGLWAVPWLMTVSQMSRSGAAAVLFSMALAMLAGFFFVAICSGWLLRIGVGPLFLLRAGMGIFVVAQFSIVADVLPASWVWPVLGFAFSLSNIAYPLLTAAFPVDLAGRVNTALNLVTFVGAFILQWGIGTLVDLLGRFDLTPAESFRGTMGGLLVLQILAYLWFLMPTSEAQKRVGS